MDAKHLIETLEARGLNLRVNGDRIRVEASQEPDLETKACPEDFPKKPLFATEHAEERLLMGIVTLWLFDIHSRPSKANHFTKFIEIFRIMIPYVSEIP